MIYTCRSTLRSLSLAARLALAIGPAVCDCAVFGCSSDDSRRVCDGSAGIRLAIAYDGQVARREVFSPVLYELGAPFLYVDGACNYWVSASWTSTDSFSGWRAIHTGKLSADQEQALADSMHYADMASFVRQCPQTTTIADETLLHLYDGQLVAGCWPDAPVLQSAQALWHDLGQKLYAAATAVQGSLRVEVGGPGIYGLFPEPPPHVWPLSTPIDDFVVPWNKSNSIGQSKRVSDPDDVAKFIALRDQYLAEQNPLGPHDPGIKIGVDYVLYLREDLPFTNEVGLAPF